MTETPSKFLLGRIFAEFLEANLRFVVLHGYDHYPEEVSSDVDLAVHKDDLSLMLECLGSGAERGRWDVLHLWRHEISAFGCLLVERGSNKKVVLLDICTDYLAGRRFLISWQTLLLHRTRHRGFFVPGPAAELTYLFCKGIVKQKPWDKLQSRQRLLWEQDTGGARDHLKAAGLPVDGVTSFEDLSRIYEEGKLARLGRPYSMLELGREQVRLIKRIAFPLRITLCLRERDLDGFDQHAQYLISEMESWFLNFVTDRGKGLRRGSALQVIRSISRVELVIRYVAALKDKPEPWDSASLIAKVRSKAMGRSRRMMRHPWLSL